MFEESTINLLYLLNCMFESVSVFKPCSSKSGNSELYVISLNYKGLEHMEHLQSTISASFIKVHLYKSKSMFDLKDLPVDFLEDINNCIDFFMVKQKQTIRDNIYHFENRTYENNFMKKSMIAELFINKYNLHPIPNRNKIVAETNVCDNWRVYPALDRGNFDCLSISSVIKRQLTLDCLQVLLGERITKVKNSKFTHQDNLNKLINISNQKQTLCGLYSFAYKMLAKENVIININSFDVNLFYEFQRDTFVKINESLNCDKNIILIGIPLITHFLVGVLYILTYAFEKICFTNGVIILYQRKNSNSVALVKSFFSIIQSQYENLDKYNASSLDTFYKDIVQVIPPYHFDQNKSALLNLIWNYNNHLFQPVSFLRPVRVHYKQLYDLIN